MNDIKMIHGIDTLYYYCETNINFEDLFLDIQDQIEHQKGIFEKKYVEYENNDINILINDIPLNFLGKAEGFYWFKDINNFFKIGFKDRFKLVTQNDIKVQLLGIGIYTIGIKSLIEFINEKLLLDVVTGFNPITRADLNCFVQYDFSFITKEMFSTRKRKYATVSEIGSATATQTLYVGKDPFKLRLYNKKEELKKSNKKDLMYEYFLNNGFDMEQPLFNVEFEMKREHLKQFNILTVDELLKNSVKLFRIAMDEIRLIDISNITEKDVKNNSKSRAKTLPIWEHIKNSYKLDEFLQTTLGLERIKRAISIYDDNKFRLEIIALLRRAFINNLQVEVTDLDGYYFEAKNSLKETTTSKEVKKTYEDLDNYINEDGKKEKLRILKDGTIIKPVNVVSVNELSDLDLHKYLDKVTLHKDLSDKDYHLWQIAHKEAIKRGFIPIIHSGKASSKKDL
ncbi:MAG: hypothetical protein KAQ94_00085 [Arcobacteraceae bacterium]|nr:hypothetical protein [Arcobacteraceae bacterium]